MSTPFTVEVINFGDELLIGIRDNVHLKYLGEQLAKHGLTIARARIIPDNVAEIKKAFSQAWADSDLVITTGGLGPTADDLTRETIAEALGAEMEFDSAIEAAIRERFAVLGRTMTEHHTKQCYRFKNGNVLTNDHGTAPGLLYKAGGKTLVMLPGPRHELCPMFEEQVIPMLQADGVLANEPTYIQLRTCGTGESAIEESMQPIIAKYDDLQVAYCAHYGIVDVRLSSREGTLSICRLKEIAQEARVILCEDFVCFGDYSLATVVFKELRALERTLAVAESCTGGMLGDAFTNVPGASKVFLGGVICYNNDVKIEMLDVPDSLLTQHGAVSAECAVAMATGAAERISTDYGLSITGFVGPDGGTEDNPVGTIHFGYHSPIGVWSKTVCHVGGRVDMKVRAVHTALDWMRRKLRQYKVHEILIYEGQN